MLNVVSGYAPRVGSSYIMREAKLRCIPVEGTLYLHGLQNPEGNPGGYYDLLDQEVEWLRSGIAKVWPRQIFSLPVEPTKLVTLKRRDQDAWLDSMQRYFELEGVKEDPEKVLRDSTFYLETYLREYNGALLEVYTEDIDDRLYEILQFIGE